MKHSWLRPNRRIVGRPKGKRDSRPRLSKSHSGLKTVPVHSYESGRTTSKLCQAMHTASVTTFPDPIYKPTFPAAGGNIQVSAMFCQRPYAFLQHTHMLSSLQSQNIGILEAITGFRPFSAFLNCHGLYPSSSTSLGQASLLLPSHPCSSTTPRAYVPGMQPFFQ